MDTMTLYKLDESARGTVLAVNVRGSMRRRLRDIGLIEGTPVLCLQRSPSGDPIAYLIRGAVIALRSEDSTNILIR